MQIEDGVYHTIDNNWWALKGHADSRVYVMHDKCLATFRFDITQKCPTCHEEIPPCLQLSYHLGIL